MRYFILILLTLLFTGCHSRTVNQGAKIEIKLWSKQEMEWNYKHLDNPIGVTDMTKNTVVILPRGENEETLILITLHEVLMHALPHEYPETAAACHSFLQRIKTKDFDPTRCAPRARTTFPDFPTK